MKGIKTMKSCEATQILKNFLYEKIGYDNIGNGIVTVIDDYTLSFKIREMSFMLVTDTMTVMRVTECIDGQTAITYANTDTITAIMERSIKEYVHNIIEGIKTANIERYNHC